MPSCASCDAGIPGGVRWCGIRHANVIGASIGRLASPGKRLGGYFLDVAVPIMALIFIISASGLGVAAGRQKAGGALGSLVGFGRSATGTKAESKRQAIAQILEQGMRGLNETT